MHQGILFGVDGVDFDAVPMSSGNGNGGSSTKWELVVSKKLPEPELEDKAA